jgi:hypothetical protein
MLEQFFYGDYSYCDNFIKDEDRQKNGEISASGFFFLFL